MENLLTVPELAKRLKVSESTVHRWRAQGMPRRKLGVRLVRYDLSLVLEWLTQQGSVYGRNN
jgi:excisionase family DNA binding protein